MREIFEQLRELDPDRDSRVCTVVDGPHIGERVLAVDGSIRARSVPDGFFARHPEAAGTKETGLLEIGGTRVFAEQISGSRKLVICGAGHVGLATARIGVMTGFDVTVIDDRAEFTDQVDKSAHAVCGGFLEALDTIPGDRDTFFVIVTRGHSWDRECLKAVAAKPHAYIGMIGSRKKVKVVLEALAESGTDAAVLKNIHSPIGLNIGAQTPAEIAVAILAEIIRVKSEQQRDRGYSGEILDALLGGHHEDRCTGPAVLMTIVRKSGSAPREAGAKMVLRSDGQTAGTVGGGKAELDALEEAKRMLQQSDAGARLLFFDMSNEEAGDAGMVCGGKVEMLLEMV